MVEIVQLMDKAIVSELETDNPREDNAENKLELWKVHLRHMLQLYKKGGNKRRVRFDPVLTNWAIVFLACTSVNTYKEVAKVMMLPSISYIYKLSNDRVSRSNQRAYSLCIQTMNSTALRANAENWGEVDRIGFAALDSASAAVGVQWDYQRKKLVGQCNEHSFQPLTNKFQKQANRLKSFLDGERDDGNKVSVFTIGYLFMKFMFRTTRSIYFKS